MELFQILATDICATIAPIIRIIRTVLDIIQIGIPIILILMGTIDLGKAVLSSDDKAIKESTSKLVKRVIAAVAVFFVVTIVKLIMGIISDSSVDDGHTSNQNWLTCWDYDENSTNNTSDK